MGKPSRKSEHHAPNKVAVKTARIAPRKARVVVDMVRGMYADDALRALKFTNRKGARIVEKLIESALANMESAGDWDIDEVQVKSAWVNEGPTLRRFLPRAMGRATRIRKRTCHIHLVLDSNKSAAASTAEAGDQD